MNGWFPVFPKAFVWLAIDFYGISEERVSFRCGAGCLPLKICLPDACLGRFRGMQAESDAFPAQWEPEAAAAILWTVFETQEKSQQLYTLSLLPKKS